MDIFLDFEIFSEADIRKVGPYAYANHPSTEPMCMAHAIDDGPVELWRPGQPWPFTEEHANATYHAHNAAFERAIFKYVMPKYGVPDIPLEQWQCTAAKCAALSLPRSLDGASKALGLDLLKDKDGHRIMLKLCKPRKPSKKNPDTRWTRRTAPEDFAKMEAYCIQDVEVERAIDRVTPPLPPSEVAVWQLDQIINDTGIPIDVEAVEEAIDALKRRAVVLKQRFRELTGLNAPTQVEKTLQWLNAQGCNVSDLSKESVNEQLDRWPEITPVGEVLRIRRELSLSSVSKFNAMLSRAVDGRVQGAHMYHGASTGRWSGVGVQFQNVIKGKLSGDTDEETDQIIEETIQDFDLFELLYDDVTTRLSWTIRSMVYEPKGLLVWDFAGIEARVLAWAAGQQDLLQAIRQGADVYKRLASRIYNVPVEDVTDAQRMVGKIAVLGLGYQMGPGRFYETCHAWGAEDVSPELAELVVKTYRETNPRIKRLWYSCQNAAIAAVENPGQVFQAGPQYKFCQSGDWLWARLPSSRKLAYYKPEIGKGKFGKQLTFMGTNAINRQWERQSTYGGKLVENLIQATARDLLASAMLRIHRAGHKILFHVHDEAIIEGTPDQQEAVEALAAQVPRWAEGCPIEVEGFASKRYRK